MNDFGILNLENIQEGIVNLFFVFRYLFKGELVCFSFFRFSFFVFCQVFDIRIRAEYRILTFEILF